MRNDLPVVKVNLSPAEMLLAATTGVHRHVAALRRGIADRNGHEGIGWNLHIEGACGEAAVAKALNRFWSASVNTFKRGGDIGDVIQIRTRSNHSYELIVRPDDAPDHVFVLVTGNTPNFVVRGWIKGSDARRTEWWKDHGGRDFAWFVPQEALFPMSELEFKTFPGSTG